MVNKALLGKIPLMIIALLFLIMPFNIYGAGETQIVPTWSSSSQQSQWSNKFRVTNFCESSNDPQNYSCQLTITVNGDYYGYVYFDGYINNQIIWDYQTMFISGGKGTFYYTWYANGLQQINKVNIAGLSLMSPTDNIDLSQIVSILTSINNYEQQIKNSVDGVEANQLTAINEIRNVVNEMVEANGYLDIIKNAPYANFPAESLPAVMRYLNEFQISQGVYDIIDYQVIDRYQYPMFRVVNEAGNYEVFSGLCYKGQKYYFVFITKLSANPTNALQYFSVNSGFQIDEIDRLYTYGYQNPDNSSSMELSTFTCYKITASYSGSGAGGTCRLTTNIKPFFIIPIYHGNSDSGRSLEFCLRWKLTNHFIENIEIIANGTTASQSAASSSDLANEQLATESNTLFQQENGFKSDMQSAMQNVNSSFRLQDMGTKFVTSAQWVRTQYEQLTNNTPFASLITFSLITGLALILLGKVYK